MCDARPTISVEERLSVISATLAQSYFGHAPTSAAVWAELERYCDAFLADNGSAEEARRSDALQEALCGVLLGNHPLSAFPVSQECKKRTFSRGKVNFEDDISTLL